MKKLINWLKGSNRYRHLIGGFILGLISLDVYSMVMLSFCTGAALEYKDKMYGNKWDWLDLSVTMVGAILSYCIKTLLL